MQALRHVPYHLIAVRLGSEEPCRAVTQGLHVVKVSTLDEAYQALVAIGQGHTDGLAGCTAS